MPEVSFIVSNYKTPVEQLKASLDSMLGQSFTDFEIVAVNDGCEDGSSELLREYARRHDNIRLIENERNSGLPYSLNRALDACGGRYAARMDTDDICLPDRLEKQVRFMDANPELLFSGAWALRFTDDPDSDVEPWQPVMCGWEEYRIRLLLDSAPLMIHPTVIFRTGLLNKAGLRYSEDEAHRYCEDYEFWTRCSRCGRGDILREPVIRYRDSENGFRLTVNKAEEMYNCRCNVLNGLFSELGIELTREQTALAQRCLNGRKAYTKEYKRLFDTIIKQNKKYRLYDGDVLETLLKNKWYEIVYYGIAYDGSYPGKLKKALSFYPEQYRAFIRTAAGKLKQE